MTEAEKDRIARMVLAVVREVREAVSSPLVPTESESTRVFVHPNDRRWVEAK